MKSVFLVIETEIYEGETVLSCHETHEGAIKKRQHLLDSDKKYSDKSSFTDDGILFILQIEEMELQK